LVQIADELQAIELIVGLPLGLDGKPGRAAGDARGFAALLVPLVAPRSVRMVDERFSTVSAARDLRAAGRTARNSRSVIDQAAAVSILQYAIDSERATGHAPGILVE
jgi:putative holliday junction resolvase